MVIARVLFFETGFIIDSNFPLDSRALCVKCQFSKMTEKKNVHEYPLWENVLPGPYYILPVYFSMTMNYVFCVVGLRGKSFLLLLRKGRILQLPNINIEHSSGGTLIFRSNSQLTDGNTFVSASSTTLTQLAK